MKNLFIVILIVVIGLGNLFYSQTVTIGKQTWMTKNLDVTSFRNGDPIPEAKTDEDWKNANNSGKPAWCYFDNNSVNEKLYNWHVVNDPRGLSPDGWHIPSRKDWLRLFKFLGEDAGLKMMTSTGWSECRFLGTNSSGFTGIPAGSRTHKGYYSHSQEKKMPLELTMWSTTGSLESGLYEGDGDVWTAYVVSLSSCKGGEIEYRLSGNGFSIRCIKD
jgi:uncharacterized protein (TIGR02145 family)